ncbi:MAG: hypothetical protein ABSE90_09080, partial [Verrucomicrobiota bacterium]
TSLAHASHETSARESALGCFAANLAVPGLGSLAVGRKIGYVQLTLCLGGLMVSLIFGVRFIYWMLAHWSEFHNSDPNADPFAALRDLWRQARWTLLGFFLFAVAWFWALFTSLVVIEKAKTESRNFQ